MPAEQQSFLILGEGKGKYTPFAEKHRPVFDSLPQTGLISAFQTDYRRASIQLGIEVDNDLALHVPECGQVIDYIGNGMNDFLSAQVGEGKPATLILGFSGDLDSAFLLSALAEFKRVKGMPWDIQTFYAKTHFHPERFRRMTQLLKYINRDTPEDHPMVGFKVFEMDLASEIMQLAVQHHYNGKPRPQDERYSRRAIDRLCACIDRGQALRDEHILEALQSLRDTSDEGLKGQELSTFFHSLTEAIRGYMARHAAHKPIIVSPQQMTEVAIHNFPHDDMGTVGPMFMLPKSVIASSFRQFCEASGGKINPKYWERSFKNVANFYVPNAQVQAKEEGMLLQRKTREIPSFSSILVNGQTTRLSEQALGRITQTPEGYIGLPGEVQFVIDPMMHFFMTQGLTEQTCEDLVSEAPYLETDIRLAAFLLSHARERISKDTRILSIPRI